MIHIPKIPAKSAIFMMGAPGAGKSYIADKHFSTIQKLDCDAIKKTHPDYDPKNPQLVHEWSKVLLERQFQETIRKDETFIMDGTGANSDKMTRQMTEARARGFNIVLVYVIVSLKTSLKRNQMRERTVPEDVVIAKYKDIDYSFKLVGPQADQVIAINNE